MPRGWFPVPVVIFSASPASACFFGNAESLLLPVLRLLSIVLFNLIIHTGDWLSILVHFHYRLCFFLFQQSSFDPSIGGCVPVESQGLLSSKNMWCESNHEADWGNGKSRRHISTCTTGNAGRSCLMQQSSSSSGRKGHRPP